MAANKVKSILAIVFLVLGFVSMAYLGYYIIMLLTIAPLIDYSISLYSFGYGFTHILTSAIVSGVLMVVFFVFHFRYKKYNKWLKKMRI